MVHKLDKKAGATFSCSLIHKGSLHIDLADFFNDRCPSSHNPKKDLCVLLGMEPGNFLFVR